MKISVVIPAYNSEQTIGRAIDSVLGQTRPAEEIIVVDDGSTDRTAERVRAYGDKVRLIQQPNAGVSVARNTGITAAAGDWIAFLDADDEWLPEKLHLQSQQLTRRPELRWGYSNFYRKESESELLQLAHMPLNKLQKKGFFEDYIFAYTHGHYAWTSVLIIHRNIFNTTGMFEPGMKYAEDNDLWFRIAYLHPMVGYLSEPLAVYHLDTPNSSTKVNNSVHFMIELVQRHEKLSKEHHCFETFRPCLTQMLQIWICKLLKQKRNKDVDQLLDCFEDYLPNRFSREIRFRMTIPVVGPAIADMLQSLKRPFKKGNEER